MWSPRDRRTIRKTFRTVAEARRWRRESQVELQRGGLRAPSSITLGQAVAEWLQAAEGGIARTRSGDPYKPSAIRSYRQGLSKYILPTLASNKLSTVEQATLQDIADDLAARGLSASTIRNALMPLRALYRRATARGIVSVNPTSKLDLPAVRGRRDRVARPDEAAKLINALPQTQQALWATAFYAGLRMGELQALDWTHIDLETNLIHVERSWDRIAGYIEPKSRASTRRVPITTTLNTYLTKHREQRSTRSDVVFPNTRGDRPFNPATTNNHARAAWAAAKLPPITLHECRHTYAAFMIAAGINPKALSTYMGHSSITITLDRYGHLLPGNEHEAAARLEQWLTSTALNAAVS